MIRRWWRWFLARFHLSQQAVCEESRGMGWYDYHDASDFRYDNPYRPVTCRHCGKEFLW